MRQGKVGNVMEGELFEVRENVSGEVGTGEC